MALTMPFINTLPAFDATIGTNTTINVLGGDAISGYSFAIYEENNLTVPIYSSQIFSVTNDVSGFTIRSFPIQISPFMGIENNHNYKIRPTTYSTTQQGGQVGNDALFSCYTTPTISLEYFDFVDDVSQYIELQDGAILPSSRIDFKISFNPNDLQSDAQPNYALINVLGINDDGSEEEISNSQNIYQFQHDTATDLYTAEGFLSGFSINVDSNGVLLPSSERKYLNYKVILTFYTIEGMEISKTFQNINCYYSSLNNSPFFLVKNICNKGVIEINCSLTSLQGASNIPLDDLVYPNNTSLDLNADTYSGFNEAWVQWQNYFNLQQPYTLRIWGRNFNSTGENSIILNMTSSIYNGYYIKLDYITEGSGDSAETYIALSAGMTDSTGQSMYPYYIESNRIATSSITSTTNLFIGIQQQNGLFDINFQILN